MSDLVNTNSGGVTRVTLVLRRLMGLLAIVLVMAAGAATAGASDDDVTAAEDNPPGCTKATGEDNDGCGAQGRDHFNNADHKAPVQACETSVSPSGSTITRILPDGPRRADDSLAFLSGACVYLPPGYETSGLRYPVIHVLHGGGGDQADWVTFGAIRDILDRAHAADPKRAVIAVMPDGRSGQWYDYQDDSFRIETYVLDHLVPYVDRHFRTISDRSGRAIVGLSNGGYGAIHLSGKRPDFFIAAGGMSSNLGGRTFSGLGPDGAVHHQGSVPYQLAENYDQVDLVLDVATHCTSPEPLCATIAVDLLFLPDHVAFDQRMDAVGHKNEMDMRFADGAHQFIWWSKWLEERQLPFLQDRLADPAVAAPSPSRIPDTFRYRSIKPSFSVWGFEVSVARDVREFLDLREVSAGGFTVQGSGAATLKTAKYYEPGGRYSVSGARDGDPLNVVADDAGRLTIPVDLGPSHTSDQFTDEADLAAQTDAGYWKVRTVTVTKEADVAPVTVDVQPEVPEPVTARSAGDLGDATPAAAGGSAEDGVEHADDGDDETAVATDPIASDGPRPQFLPTIVFLALLAAGPAIWWQRKRRSTKEES